MQAAKKERLPKAAGDEVGEAAQGCRGRERRGFPRLQGAKKERLPKAAGARKQRRSEAENKEEGEASPRLRGGDREAPQGCRG